MTEDACREPGPILPVSQVEILEQIDHEERTGYQDSGMHET